MMKILILLSITLLSCAHKPPLAEKTTDDLVRVSTVMDQVQQSYLKGCVDAFKNLGHSGKYIYCRDQSVVHRQEIQSILDQD